MHSTTREKILTAVKLALAFELGDGTPETELSVPFEIVVEYKGAEETATGVVTAERAAEVAAGSAAEEVGAEETGASLVASEVAVALLAGAGAADDAGAGADEAAAGADEAGAGADEAAAEVCAGAADEAAPLLPAGGTSSCLPDSGSVLRPHFVPALLRLPP